MTQPRQPSGFDNFALRLTPGGQEGGDHMAIQMRAHSGAKPTPRLRLPAWLRRLRPLRALWGYALAALALLAVSQALWLWHSWPVRELLDRDQFLIGLAGLAI